MRCFSERSSWNGAAMRALGTVQYSTDCAQVKSFGFDLLQFNILFSSHQHSDMAERSAISLSVTVK